MGELLIESISKHFGNAVACDDISLSIAQGELFYLLGPSGCGKSTLLNIIAGLEHADRGSLTLGGQNIDALPAHQRPIHTIFQSYALFPHLTVFENVAFALRMRKIDDQEVTRRVKEALLVGGLEGFEQRYPSELSGGQQQRVAIARAIINRPVVLLLDEPFGALDARIKSHMQQELKRIQRGLHLTFLCVSHDQEEALSTADRIAVMNNGRIEQVGTPEEIYCRPNSRFVAEFIGDVNFFVGTCEHVEDGVSTIRCDDGIRFQITESLCPGRSYTGALRPERIEILSVSQEWSHISSVSGIVREVVYLGPTAALLVEVSPQRTCRVEFSITGTGTHPIVGDTVRLGWEPNNIVLVHT